MGRIGNTLYQPVQQVNTGWKSQLEKLAKLRKDYEDGSLMMTPYERARYGAQLNEESAVIEKMVTNGAVQEFNGVLDNYQQAQQKMKNARMRETASWEPSKLSNEIRVTRELVDIAVKSNDVESLRQLYDENVGSGDRYKQRATMEVFRGLLSDSSQNTRTGDMEVLSKLNHLSRQAVRDLPKLRYTPEVQSAENNFQAATQAIDDGIRQLENYDRTLYGGSGNRMVGGQFVRAAARAVWLPEKNEYRIRSEDDAFGNRELSE